jgi:hypothetical protein
MNTENMIEITGCELIEVVKAAYDFSRPQGMGFFHYEEGSLSEEEAAKLVREDDLCPVSLDYVKGRACKLTVFKDEDRLYVAKRWFDHSEADLAKLLDRIGISVS